MLKEESGIETTEEPLDRPSGGRVAESEIGFVGLGHMGTV